MQTAHIWPIHHLLLENNPAARKCRKDGACEVLVVINNGKIVEVIPPHEGQGEFRDRQDLLGVITRSWERGVETGCGKGPQAPLAPEGWILWQDLQPGTLAYDGNDQHILRFRLPFNHTERQGSVTSGFGLDPAKIALQTTKVSPMDLVWLDSERTRESVQTFNPKPRYDTPFLKIIRQGLSQAQCVEIRAMCKDGNYAAFRPSYILDAP